MARPRKPWFRKERNAWFVEVDGKQVPLGEHPPAFPPPVKSKTGWNPPPPIVAAYGRLMEKKGDQKEETTPKDSVVSLLGAFLDWTKENKSEATYEQRRHFLASFVKFKGVRTVRPDKVTVALVESWLKAHPKWKASRRHATLILLRAFNWGVRRGSIARNPITGIEVPRQKRVMTYLTADQRKAVHDATRDKAFKQFLSALQETGCRPGEISAVEAAHVDLNHRLWTLPQHKTEHSTGKPRTVFLNDTMLALTQELVALRPAGPLFLNYRKKPWNINSVRCRFRKLRKAFPKFGHFTATSFRRAFVTDALERGVDVAKVAELVGHTSTDMIMRHYNQLQERVRHMREMANKATG